MDTTVKFPASTRSARLLRLAEFIDHEGQDFDMECWDACIAGQCARMTNGRRDIREGAKEYLLLDFDQAKTLFAPSLSELGLARSDHHLSVISRRWAANTLRYFAMTGKLDWKAARTGAGDLRRPDQVRSRFEGVESFQQIGDVAILTVVLGPDRERSEPARQPELA